MNFVEHSVNSTRFLVKFGHLVFDFLGSNRGVVSSRPTSKNELLATSLSSASLSRRSLMYSRLCGSMMVVCKGDSVTLSL